MKTLQAVCSEIYFLISFAALDTLVISHLLFLVMWEDTGKHLIRIYLLHLLSASLVETLGRLQNYKTMR